MSQEIMLALSQSHMLKKIAKNKEDLIKTNIEKYAHSEERKKYLSQPGKIAKTHFFRRRCRELFRKDGKILDIGGGAGTWTDIIKEEGITNQIYALDISPDILEERNKNDISIVGDMRELPFPNNFFDHTTFFGSLHHSYDIPGTLEEAKRVLKSDGSIFLFEPVSLRLLALNKGIEPVENGAEFCFSQRYLLKKVREKFSVIDFIYYDGFIKRYLNKHAGINILKAASRMEEFFNSIPALKSLLGYFSNYIIIVARK